MHNLCLSFYNWNFSRETFTRTWSIYPIKHIFVSIPNRGVEHFWLDRKHVVAYPQCGSSKCMWSDKFLNKGHKVWPNSIQWEVVYVEGFPSLSYMALVGNYFTIKERCSYSFFRVFEIKFSNNDTSRIKFSLFYYISFHNNLTNMGSLIISSQQ